MNKRFLGIIVLFVSFVGCTQRTNTNKNVQIEYMYSGSIENIHIMGVVKKVFEKENPGYELKLNFVPNWGVFRTKTLTSITGGVAPDIIVDGPSKIYDLYDRNSLYDLTDFVTKDQKFQKIKKDIYPPQFLEVGKIKGKYWAIPAWQNPAVIFYNKKIFKDAGIDFPSDKWTFEQFTDTMKKLTKRDENGKITQYGFIYALGWLQGLLPLNATTVINQKGTEVILNNQRAYNILKWYYDLIFTYKCTPLVIKGQTDSMMQPHQVFQMGRAAMLMGGHYLKRELLKTKELDFDAAVVPKMNKNGRILNNSVFWMVLNKGKNTEGALKLLNYLAGVPFQEEMCKVNSDVPILKSIQSSDLFLRPGEKPEHAQAFLDSLKDPFFGERCLSDIFTGNALSLESAFNQKKDLKEALKEDAEVIKKGLNGMKKEGKLDFENF
ncbi:MAG: extracellular solute-binding protein [Candidatus Firestonebacteria bacterium]